METMVIFFEVLPVQCWSQLRRQTERQTHTKTKETKRPVCASQRWGRKTSHNTTTSATATTWKHHSHRHTINTVTHKPDVTTC